MTTTASDQLKRKKEQILALWEARSLKEVPSAVTAESLVLRDSLPLYLDHLSDALATNRKMDTQSVFAHAQEGIRIGRMHGEDRADRTSYVLTEVIFEYHILREVIFQVLEEQTQLPALQRDIILDSVEQAVNDAVVKFSEVHAEVRQTYISTLTHDLKNPITSAKMSAQLILRHPENSESCTDLASKIVLNLNRLNRMIHDLLDAGRVRAGEQLSLEFVQCDLKPLVGEVIDEMTTIHGDRFVFKANPAPALGNWGVDGLRRALENLIQNAVKYGSPDTAVTVSLESDLTNAKLSVHNQGPAIPENEIPLMFQQYRRSKSAVRGKASGWGLGLTLVKGVADAHQGKIRIESVEGKGTTFTLELPVRERPAAAIHSARQPG